MPRINFASLFGPYQREPVQTLQTVLGLASLSLAELGSSMTEAKIPDLQRRVLRLRML